MLIKPQPTTRYLFFFEGLKELNDVGSCADVDEQQLGELVMRQFALRQQPASQDEDEQEKLLDGAQPLVRRQPDGDADLQLQHEDHAIPNASEQCHGI